MKIKRTNRPFWQQYYAHDCLKELRPTCIDWVQDGQNEKQKQYTTACNTRHVTQQVCMTSHATIPP